MSEGRNSKTDDAAFADGVLKALPGVTVPAELEARILADFDAAAAKRKSAAPTRWLDRWRGMLWPGAPLWKPASIMALSLLVGLAAGAAVPSPDAATPDQANAAADASSVMDISGDF